MHSDLPLILYSSYSLQFASCESSNPKKLFESLYYRFIIDFQIGTKPQQQLQNTQIPVDYALAEIQIACTTIAYSFLSDFQLPHFRLNLSLLLLPLQYQTHAELRFLATKSFEKFVSDQTQLFKEVINSVLSGVSTGYLARKTTSANVEFLFSGRFRRNRKCICDHSNTKIFQVSRSTRASRSFVGSCRSTTERRSYSALCSQNSYSVTPWK